jgi:Flp pilus assembly protein TadB
MERSMNDPHERPVVTETNKEAVRAGHTGDHVRYILIASCALVIIAFIAIALLVRP